MKVMLFANTAWYLFNFRLALATKLRDLGMDVVLMAPQDQYVDKLEELGFRVITIPLQRRSLNPWREFRLLLFIREVMQRECPDLIHNFTIKSVIYGSLAARSLGKNTVGVVNSVTGMGCVYSQRTLKSRVLRQLVSWLLRMSCRQDASKVIVQNPDDRQVMLSHHLVEDEDIYLIRGSGVNGKRFGGDSFRTSKRDQCRVLFASRLLWDKGVDHYVEAARRLADHRRVEFLIAGLPDEGNPNSVTEDDISTWQQSANIVYLGHVDDMDRLLQQVDVVVLPSLYGEGVPRILVEAAASRLPLVTYDVPGCREIVSDGENGFLVSPSDVDKLVAAIDQLLQAQTLREQMGKASRQRFLKEYEEGTVLSNTLDVYNKVYSKMYSRAMSL